MARQSSAPRRPARPPRRHRPSGSGRRRSARRAAGARRTPRSAHGIAQPVSGADASGLRRGVHRDERRSGVRLAGNDADGPPVQRWIGRLLARGEEAVGVEVEPRGGGGHGIVLGGRPDPEYAHGSGALRCAVGRPLDGSQWVGTIVGSPGEALTRDALARPGTVRPWLLQQA